ncbi:MAG: HU family DNA-binding protein [Bacteroidales bacterium]|nr:HU family DNA-binding protein [Bacteroidales bacterium]
MDNKTICARVAKEIGQEPAQAARLIDTFAKVMRERISNLDSIAIPGFGNFVALKLPERVQSESSTGKRTLLPPQIKVEFVASAMLKKQLENN